MNSESSSSGPSPPPPASLAFRPPWLKLQSATSTTHPTTASSVTPANANAATIARPVVAASTLVKTQPTQVVKKQPAAVASLVGISSAGDGLPVLPSHARRCTVDPPLVVPQHDGAYGYEETMMVVDLYGEVSSRDAIRAKLLRFYEETKQIVLPNADDTKRDGAAVSIGSGISEMTLRIDTELELLRQQCFAERNAQWKFYTPDMFTYEPAGAPQWDAQLVGNRKLAWKRKKQDAIEKGDEKEMGATTAANSSAKGGKKGGYPIGEFARERPWPPKEFAQKASTRPSRARGGKRKTVAVVVEEKSVFSRMCSECQTQSTPLWRKLTREVKRVPAENEDERASDSKKESVQPSQATGDAVVVAAMIPQRQPTGDVAPPATTVNGIVSGGEAAVPVLPATTDQVSPAATQRVEVDVCLECYLKLQRRDMFERKQAEKAKQAREKQERLAAEALAEKKRLKQQIQFLRKQQQAQAKSSSKQQQRRKSSQDLADVRVPSPVPAPSAPVKIVIKSDVFIEEEEEEEEVEEETLVRLQVEQPKRKDKKKSSKKDKKKKKKKSKRNPKEAVDDSESDSGTPMPSPPQMDGAYEYADVGAPSSSRAASSVPSFDAVGQEYEDEPTQRSVVEQRGHLKTEEASVEDVVLEAPTSKRSRKSTTTRKESISISTSMTPAATTAPLPAPSSSRKRKSSVVAAASDVSIVETTTISAPSSASARSSRSKSSAAPPPTPPAAASTTPLPSARKRARTKKETARERELRALGQYCPVCNATYEEDDESSFVCCDSCEMWVHGNCDLTLTPYVPVALLLCGGVSCRIARSMFVFANAVCMMCIVVVTAA